MASAQGIRAGKAYVEVGANNAGLLKGLQAAQERVQAFGKGVAAVGGTLAGLGASISAPLLGAAKSFADAGSALNDASARTGVSVEALSTLSFAANQTGTDLETVEGAIRKMQKALVAGSEENLQAAGTFASLGLSVESLMRLSPDQQFERMAKAIAAIPDPTAKAGAAMQVFGKSGTAIIPLIDDMQALSKQARELGLVMSAEDAAAADALGDAMDTVGASLKRAANVVGAALAPVLTEVADTLARVIKTTVDWVAANQALIVTALKVGAGLAAAGAALVVIGGAIVAIANPIGLVIAGLVALGTWFVRSTTVGGQALAWLGKRFNELTATARAAFKGMADALRAGNISLAAEILWAGLKVQWLKGTGGLRKMWAEWGTAVVEVFRGVTFGIAGAWIDAMARIESVLAKSVSNLTGLWGDLMIAMVKRLVPLEGVLGKIFGVDIGKALQDAVANAASEANAKANEAAVAGQLTEIEKRRKDSRAALASQQDTEVEARRKAAQDGLKADAEKLKAAQDELAALTGKAAAGAAGARDVAGPGKAAAFTPESLDQSLSQAKAKVDVTGSFSTAALGRMGVGSSVADEQLKEQKKANDQLEKLNKKAAVGRLVFN
jgi:hypothetical protein